MEHEQADIVVTQQEGRVTSGENVSRSDVTSPQGAPAAEGQSSNDDHVSIMDHFRPQQEGFGPPGLLIPISTGWTIDSALERLGTPIPVIDHVKRVAKVTRKSWVLAARSLGTPPAERLSRAIALDSELPFFPRDAIDTIDPSPLKGTIPETDQPLESIGLPVAVDGNKLMFVVSDAKTRKRIEGIWFQQGYDLSFCIASGGTIEQLYRRKFANTEEPFDEALSRVTEDPKRVVQRLVIHAAAMGASDIHMEPREDHGALLLRIDGVRETFRILDLTRSERNSTEIGGAFGRIIQVIISNSGNKDIDMTAEGDFDEMIPDELKGRFDFRLQLSNCIYGKRAVIRLLDQSGDVGEMEDLGVDLDTKERLENIINSDSGLLLFVGPTGSGKSTTQAALLKSINAVQDSVQTIENPVETRSGMWVQHPLSRRGEGDEASRQRQLAKGLLRCDPEVVQVQELRDADNTMVAAEAANTGHLVFATLHANSAALSIVRMRGMRSNTTGEALDMSVVAPVLRGIMAQRLIRKVCPHCREVDGRSKSFTAIYRSKPYFSGTIYRAATQGCHRCRYTGYSGRRLIYELMSVDMDLSERIQNGATVQELTNMMPIEQRMIGRGYQAVVDGVTTVDEVHRVVSD